VALLTLPFIARDTTAQSNNVNDCAVVLVKDYYSYSRNSNLNDDYLQIIDQDNWSTAKQSLASGGSAYGGLFTGNEDYQTFDQKRTKYFESVHYRRSKQEALNILQITTSDRAYSAYENCLQHVASGPALLVWAASETMEEIDLRVKYVNSPTVKEIWLRGDLVGGAVAGAPVGKIWKDTSWLSRFVSGPDRWGINEEKSFRIRRTSGTAETTITVAATDGSSPVSRTFKRADAVLTLTYVGSFDVFRRTVQDNRRIPYHNGAGRTTNTRQLTASPPRFLKNPLAKCEDLPACLYVDHPNPVPTILAADGSSVTSTLDNWGSDATFLLQADEYEHLSSTQCGSDQKVPVLFGHPVLITAVKECLPLAKIKWETLGSTPSQGALSFGAPQSAGREVSRVGDVQDSVSELLASYQITQR
jgi:hypothetical protein